MNSRIFECNVMHERFSPRRHRFDYSIFMLAIDLDELPRIDREFRLLSVNAPNVYSFRESDHLPTGEPIHNPTSAPDPTRKEPACAVGTLKDRVSACLRENGIEKPLGRVELITMPRILGYQFNPVSFYFCHSTGGEPLAAIAEVTNTFREVKVFVLPGETFSNRAFRMRVPKNFYVSPYSDVDVAFDFVLRPASERLAVGIDDYEGNNRSLASTLVGRAVPLSDPMLAWFSIKYPFLTLKVITLIHWHALVLYLKRVPWFRKAARSQDQRDLYRPHSSLSTASPLDQ